MNILVSSSVDTNLSLLLVAATLPRGNRKDAIGVSSHHKSFSKCVFTLTSQKPPQVSGEKKHFCETDFFFFFLISITRFRLNPPKCSQKQGDGNAACDSSLSLCFPSRRKYRLFHWWQPLLLKLKFILSTAFISSSSSQSSSQSVSARFKKTILYLVV